MEKPYRPFFLTAAIILLDQLTKWLIVSLVPYHTVARSFGGDFLRIIHTRNLAVAFSLGNGFPQPVKLFLFILVPLIALVAISVYLVKGRDLSSFQRWVLAAIVGGGAGDIIDRIFRPEGVVDFIDVKFYGLFGLDRWPTFNVADSTVVVAGIALLISFFLEERKQ